MRACLKISEWKINFCTSKNVRRKRLTETLKVYLSTFNRMGVQCCVVHYNYCPNVRKLECAFRNTMDADSMYTTFSWLSHNAMRHIGYKIMMQCSAGKSWVLASMWMPLEIHHPSKYCGRPSRPFNGKGTLWWQCIKTALKWLEDYNKEHKASPWPPDSSDPVHQCQTPLVRSKLFGLYKGGMHNFKQVLSKL